MTRPGGRSPPPGLPDEPIGNPSSGSVSAGADSSLSPDEAPKQCSRCSRPLTVGERMFYFLEGAGSVPACRECLARRQEMGDSEAAETLAMGFPNDVASPYEGSSEGARPLAHAVRRFLEDEMDRLDRVVDGFPEDHPDLPLLRSVQQEAQAHLSHDRLAEAIVSVSDLRRILTEVDRGRRRVPLSSPWEQSIEELFDRVVTRARAMSRRLPPLPEWDEELIEPVVHGPWRDTEAPS